MYLTGELSLHNEDLARTLDVDIVRPVDHDLGDLTVTQQRFQWSEAEDLVGDLLGDTVAVRCRKRVFSDLMTDCRVWRTRNSSSLCSR